MPVFDEEAYGGVIQKRAKRIEYEVDDNGCWNYTSHHFSNGYPRFKRKRKGYNLSNYVYNLINQVCILPGFVILHKCDNPACINPEHLTLGTHKDNVDDKIQKGRDVTIVGSERSTAILDEEKVREIKIKLRNNQSMASIAREYGVAPTTIQNIRDGRNWKHVKEE